MSEQKLPEEIRKDVIELFPTILDIKHLFYSLSNELTLTTMNEEVLVSDEYYQKELRWRISFATLKRLDSINHDWSVIPPQTLLHTIPNLYNESPLFLEDNDRTVLDKSEKNIQTSPSPSYLLQYNNDEYNPTADSKIMGRFLPQRNLDDFKLIQSCLKKQQKPPSRQLCELDNARFKFD